MGIKNVVMKNLGWLVLSDVADKILSFIVVTLLARYLGANNFGIYSFVISFVLIFGTISDFGFPTITLRDLARNKKKSSYYIGNIITLKLIISIIVFSLIVLSIKMLNKSPEINYLVYLGGLWAITSSFTQFFSAIFRAYEKMFYETLVVTFENILKTTFVIFIVVKSLSLSSIFLLYTASTVFSFLLAFFFIVKHFTKFTLRFDFSFFKYIIKESWPIMLGASSVTVYAYVNSIFLSVYHTDLLVGLFNAGYKLVIVLAAGRRILAVAIYPALSRFYVQSKEKLKALILKSEKIALTFAIPATFATIILAEKIINLVYGSAYVPGAIALKITIFQMLIIYINLSFIHMLNISGNQRWYLFTVTSGALLNLALNFILVPKFGMVGAGISTVISEFLVLLISYIKTYSLIQINILPLFVKPIIASIIMSIVLLLIINWNVLIITVIGLATYLVTLYLINGIRKEDFHLE